ncbi:hypothetical protein WMO79_01675 [Micrococcaceae bacterium Sec7.4]
MLRGTADASQRQPWSLDGVRKLWSASNAKIYGGGVSEVGYLDEMCTVSRPAG